MNLAVLLTVLFIGLKLGGIIDWNWFLVILPVILKVIFEGALVIYYFWGEL